MQVFQNEDQFIDTVVADLISDLGVSIQNNGNARILLSGGSTPGPIYKALDKKCGFIKDVKIGLVDERFVPMDSEFSNERLIRNCFSKLPTDAYDIHGMVHDAMDEVKNLDLLKASYQDFKNRTDVVILGMGPDGHTASIFPGDAQSNEVLDSNENSIFSTRAPNYPERRITCSLDLITNATSIYLIISGNEKRKVLEDEALALPIHNVLEKRNDVKLYYLEK